MPHKYTSTIAPKYALWGVPATRVQLQLIFPSFWDLVSSKSKLIVNLINKSPLPPYVQVSCVFMALHYCWSSFPFKQEESYPSYWLG